MIKRETAVSHLIRRQSLCVQQDLLATIGIVVSCRGAVRRHPVRRTCAALSIPEPPPALCCFSLTRHSSGDIARAYGYSSPSL